MPLSPKEIALLVSQEALSKKAQQVVVLEMIGLTDFTDYFVICSGTSDVQVRAITDAIEEVLEKEKVRIDHKEGYQGAQWILLDIGPVVVHIFYHQTREFYELEQLWADAKMIELEDDSE